MLSKLSIPSRFEAQKSNLVFLADTDVLSDMCKKGPSKDVEEKLLQNGAILLFSLTSIMELGFGPTTLSPEEEITFYRDLYSKQSSVQRDLFVHDFYNLLSQNKLESYKGKWIGISPDSHNWFAAKKSLVSLMNEYGSKPKNAKELQIDMLLSCAAANGGAFVWSNNVKDHLLASYFLGYNLCTRNRDKKSKEAMNCLAHKMPPIFSTDLLIRVLNGETFNIYSEMKLKAVNQDIIDVLTLAETQLVTS